MDSSNSELEPVEVLANDFIDRQRRGEQPTVEEYVERHPDLADEIREVFPALAMMEQVAPASADLSEAPGPVTLDRVGDYRIIREIGRGGMGVVYEAEQQSLRRRVALKVLPRQQAGDANSLARFQREARAAARMHHTNIVPVFEVGDSDEHVFYAMQLIHGQGLDLVVDDLKRLRTEHSRIESGAPVDSRGDESEGRSIAASLISGRFEQENLADQLGREKLQVPPGERAPMSDAEALRRYAETVAHESGPAPSAVLPGQSELSTAETDRRGFFQSVAQIGLQTARALSYAHARGIIHRDIKPSNLLLDATGVVWVTDFGLAKTSDEAMTHSGDILGTIRYMSPERFRGECDARADLYSLGLTLYELLILEPAFSSADRLKLIDMVSNAEPPTPRSIDPRIPRDLETIILKSIDKDAKRRYQSADEMSEDLHRLINDEPIKARRISLAERSVRWSRRNKGLASMTVAIASLLVTFTVASALVARDFRQLAADESRARKQQTVARKQAQDSAAIARSAKETAERQREEAVAARKEAVAAREEAEAARYVADMNFARTLYEAGSILQLKDLLLRHIPIPGTGAIDRRKFEWYHWWRAAHLAAVEIPVSSGSAAGRFAVSADGKLVCVAHWNDRVSILNRATRTTIVSALKVPPGLYQCRHTPCFSSDGLTLYSAGIDGTVACVDTTTWKRAPDLVKNLAPIGAITVSPKRQQMAIAMQHEIHILDTQSGETLGTLAHEGQFGDMAFSPDGGTLVVGLQHGLARITGLLKTPVEPVWVNVPQVPAWRDMPANSNAVARVVHSRDGKWLATCGYDGVRLWDPMTYEPTRLFHSPSAVQAVAISAKGTRLAGSTNEDNEILVWDTDWPNRRPRVIHGHNKKVLDLAFPKGDNELWSSGDAGMVMVWDLKRSQPYDRELLDSAPQRTAMFFHADGRRLLIGDDSASLKSHDVTDVTQKKLVTEGAAAVAVNGDWMVVWSSIDKKVRLWDKNDNLVLEWPVDHIRDRNLAVSRDGSTVAWTRSNDGDRVAQITILRTSPGEKPQSTALTDGEVVEEVVLSPDGKRCAVRGEWATNFWDLGRTRPVWGKTLPNTGPDICSRFSPDGKLLAVGSWNNDVRIHDARTGELLRTLKGHSSFVSSLVFSGDGGTLVSGSDGGAIKLWDPHRGTLRSTFRGHVGRIFTLAIAPDGRAIASFGADRWLRVWRAAGGAKDESWKARAGEQLHTRAQGHLFAAEYAKALDDYLRAAVLLPNGSFDRSAAAYRAAFLLVHFDRIDEYRQLCRRIAAEYAQSDDIHIQERMVKMCAFADITQHQDVVTTMSRFAESVAANLDREAKEKPKINSILRWIHQALGIAAYREGNYAEACERLEKSNSLFEKSGNDLMKVAQTSTNFYYLALATHQSGQMEHAKKHLATANAAFAKLPENARQRTYTDWVVLQRARSEVDSLIKPE